MFFEKYKQTAISEGRLFNIISIDTGSECLLRLIYTSHKAYITIYNSYALVCNILLIKKNRQQEGYDIKVLEAKEIPINDEKVLHELKRNTDQIKNIINIIKITSLKKDNSLMEEKESDDENFNDNGLKEYTKHIKTDFQKIKNFKIANASETNKKKLYFELKNFFELFVFLQNRGVKRRSF